MPSDPEESKPTILPHGPARLVARARPRTGASGAPSVRALGFVVRNCADRAAAEHLGHARWTASRDRVDVVEDQHGCPTSALDLADAVLVLIDRWLADSSHGARQVYHLAGPDRVSWAEFAREILVQSAATGGPSAEVQGIPASAYPTRARRPRNSALDSSRFAAMFGYRAPPLRTSLERVVSRLVGADSALA